MTTQQQRPLSGNFSYPQTSENSSPDRSDSSLGKVAPAHKDDVISNATSASEVSTTEAGQSDSKSPAVNGKTHAPRPVSEILTTGIFEPPEDAWIKNLSQYEKTLEEMATTSLDQNFKDELAAVQQWFKALSDSERTAGLYSLLQQSNPVQVRFFIAALLQMAKNDPLNVILSNQHIAKVEDILKHTPPAGETKAHGNNAQTIPGISIGAATPTNSSNNRSRRLYDRYSLPAGIPEEVTTFLSNLDNEDVNHRLTTQIILEGRHGSNGPNATNGNQGSAYLLANNQQPSYNYRSRPNSQHEADPTSIFASNMFLASQNLSANGTGRTVGRSGQRPRSFCGVDAIGGTWRLKEPSNERSGSAMGDYSSLANNWGMPLSPTLASFTEHASRGVERPKSRNEDSDIANLHLNQLRINEANAARELFESELKSPNGNSSRRNANPAGLTIAVHEDYPIHDNFPRSANSLAPGSARNRNSFYGEDSLRSPAYVDGNRLQSPLQSPLYPPQHHSRSTSRASSPIPPGFIPHWAQDSMKRLMNQNPQAAKQYVAMMQGAGSAGLNEGYQVNEKRDHHRGGNLKSDHRSIQSRGVAANKNKSTEVVDLELLKDVPAWLRSLRLHKYTPMFEGMKWQDIIQLSDDELTAKGVAALGARRKMLKVFEGIKNETGL